MYFFLLIFCIFGIIVNADESGDSDDEGKFIDLLPDDEKDAFIESVARRLITGVKTKDTRYNSGEEVSDEALNQQSEYVRKVLQEESGNLRRSGKMKVDSDEKIKVQALDKKPTEIHEDEEKDNIDLTFGQSHRRKRNEVDNEQFIPVKTVYDDENDRSIIAESNTKDQKDENKNINTKSKEHNDENSTTEDIQVRGPRNRARGLPQASTDRSNLRDSSINATAINDFEPEDSSEYITAPNESHGDVSSDKNENEVTETATIQEVKISFATNDDVESSHNGFTESIFEPQEPESEVDHKSNESVELVTATTTIVEKAKEVETGHPSTTTQEAVKETTTENVVQNTTNKKQFLRVNLNSEDIEKELGRPLNETKVEENSLSRNTDELMVTDLNVTHQAHEIVKKSMIESKNDYFESLSNDTGIITRDNKSYSNNEEDQNKYNNKNNYLNMNKSDNKAIIAELPTNIEVENNQSSAEINQKGIDRNKETEKHHKQKSNKTSKEIHDSAEKNSEINNVKDSSSQMSDVKYLEKDKSSKENTSYVTTTENYKQDDDKHYITKEINTSYVVNNLRSDINIDIDIVPIELNKTQSNNVEHRQHPDSLKQVEFEDTFKNKEMILTTTEKINENMSKNDSVLPKYSVYYSKYVPDDAKDDNSNQNNENDLNHDNNGKFDEKEGDKLNYKSQSVNLERIEKVLRERVSQEEDNQSEEALPKLLQSSGKIKEYIVYEIPADQTPFVQTNSEPKEQPYYAPVYNYAPNNAYYNAYNRLGPNDEDNNDEILNNKYESDESVGHKSTESFYIQNLDEPNGHRTFKFHSKKPKETLKVKQHKNSFGLPLVIKKPKYTQILFNPDEYLDMDYYFGRSNAQPNFRKQKKRKTKSKIIKRADSYFPNSDEESHPYNSLSKDNIKGHMSAVRQMLYQHKLFGFVTDTATPTSADESITNNHEHHNHKKGDPDDVKSFRADNRSEYIIILPNGKQRTDYPNQEDISIDYYFGLYDTKNQPEGKRYEDFLRRSKDEHTINDKTVYKPNRAKLSNLIGEIEKRRRSWKNSIRKNKHKDPHQDMKDEWMKNAGTIKDILEIGETRDIFQNLEKLQQLNITLMRRREGDEDVKVYVNVLRDMVKMDNRALEKFDWLRSTVDVLGAIKKLKYLTEHQYYQDEIHPSDLQLLKYVLYLYKLSRYSLEDPKEETEMLRGQTKKTNLLPRNKNRKKEYLTKGLLNRVWLYFRLRNVTQGEPNENDLDFLEFLEDLRYSLYDLHNALMHISMVTKYNKQQWFLNLKSLYLKKTEKKEMLVTLLQIFTTRLLELIEKSSMSSLEDGYLQYVEQNEKEVIRTKEEFVFVLKLLKEIKNLNN